jgi:hypothetical protein
MMADKPGFPGSFGLIVAAVVIITAMTFLLTGGDLGGRKKVEKDADLPKITSPEESAR